MTLTGKFEKKKFTDVFSQFSKSFPDTMYSHHVPLVFHALAHKIQLIS